MNEFEILRSRTNIHVDTRLTKSRNAMKNRVATHEPTVYRATENGCERALEWITTFKSLAVFRL